jgi:hypothetical protein
MGRGLSDLQHWLLERAQANHVRGDGGADLYAAEALADYFFKRPQFWTGDRIRWLILDERRRKHDRDRPYHHRCLFKLPPRQDTNFRPQFDVLFNQDRARTSLWRALKRLCRRGLMRQVGTSAWNLSVNSPDN